MNLLRGINSFLLADIPAFPRYIVGSIATVAGFIFMLAFMRSPIMIPFVLIFMYGIGIFLNSIRKSMKKSMY